MAAKEWIENLTAEIKQKNREAAEEFGREKRQADIIESQGRVFFSAMGDRPENWSNKFMLDVLAGGIRWATHQVDASIPSNIKTAAPGYAEIPPKYPSQK